MRNKKLFVVMLALVALMCVGMFVTSASAATIDDLLTQIAALQAQLLALNGGGQPTEPPAPVFPSSNLSNSIQLPGFSFGYNTSTDGGKTNFDAWMSNVDRITNVSVNIGKQDDGTYGWVSANFSGIVGETVSEMDQQSQSMNIDRRGVHYGSSVNLGSYHEIIGWTGTGKDDWTPIYGDWLSNASVGATLFGVTPTYANSGYYEWTDEGSNTTHFNAYASWQFTFATNTPAFSTSMSVPEPATMSLLAIGGIGLLRRRRR